MQPNEALVHRFYEAFAARDAAAMGALYAEEGRFHDPVFGDLPLDDARAMWRMLVERGEDLVVTHRDVRADGARVRAHWDATYTFRATGRKVRNSIDATFLIRDGRIVEHWDHFSLWRWAHMALGPKGTLLGWTPLVRGKVRALARTGLRRFVDEGR